MSDYIKREDAENAIIGCCEESALWKLRHLSSADVVEVGRPYKRDDRYYLEVTKGDYGNEWWTIQRKEQEHEQGDKSNL